MKNKSKQRKKKEDSRVTELELIKSIVGTDILPEFYFLFAKILLLESTPIIQAGQCNSFPN